MTALDFRETVSVSTNAVKMSNKLTRSKDINSEKDRFQIIIFLVYSHVFCEEELFVTLKTIRFVEYRFIKHMTRVMRISYMS